MDDTTFEGWALKVSKGKSGFQVECRKTIGDSCDIGGRSVTVAGQVLLIVTLNGDGWKWQNQKGDTAIRDRKSVV